MCEPTTIAIASLALTAASTGMSVLGQMNRQSSDGAQASYMRQVQEQNQRIAQQQADAVRKQGQIDADKQRLLTSQKIGTQTSKLAAQGTDLSGSPTDILGDTAAAGELDALTIKSNAAKNAWGYEVQGTNAGSNAALYGAFQPSNLGAGASLLGGASTLADKWSKFQWPGGGGSGGTYGLDPVGSAGFAGNPTAGV